MNAVALMNTLAPEIHPKQIWKYLPCSRTDFKWWECDAVFQIGDSVWKGTTACTEGRWDVRFYSNPSQKGESGFRAPARSGISPQNLTRTSVAGRSVA
jgi:hypothetical protein